MNAGEILQTILEMALAITGLAILAVVLTNRHVSGFGAFLLGGVAGIALWLAIWLEWFLPRDWSWWAIAGSMAGTFYLGAIASAIAWSYLDDQRERLRAAEIEAAETRQRVLGPPVH